jgi:hypothetical protein
MQNPALNQPFVDPVRLSVTLPTLEYWYAFSVCAVEAERGESVIVMASSAYYARELLKRVVTDNAGVTLVPLGGDWSRPLMTAHLCWASRPKYPGSNRWIT